MSAALSEMSIAGGVMILGVVLLRSICLNRLPKAAFVMMWQVVLIRLLLPLSVEIPVLPAREAAAVPESPIYQYYIPENFDDVPEPHGGTVQPAYAASEKKRTPLSVPYKEIWAVGAAGMAVFFALAYVRGIKRFGRSEDAESDYVGDWAYMRGIKPPRIRLCGGVESPLTYGIFRPVIVLPADTDLLDRRRLGFILEHEYGHIRGKDALNKLLMTAALCLHWFNPAVWAMYALFNADMELRCDERVIRRFGERSRAEYARMLISMEELKSGAPLMSSLRKNSVEERIVSIMKFRKTTVISAIAAVLCVAAVTTAIVATSVVPVPKEAENVSSESKNPVFTTAAEDGEGVPEPAIASQMNAADAKITEDGDSGTYGDGETVAPAGEMTRIETFRWPTPEDSDYKARGCVSLGAGTYGAVVLDLGREADPDEVTALQGCLIQENPTEDVVYTFDIRAVIGEKVYLIIKAPETDIYRFGYKNGGGADLAVADQYFLPSLKTNGEKIVLIDDAVIDTYALVGTSADSPERSAAVPEDVHYIAYIYTASDGTAYYQLYGTRDMPSMEIALPVTEEVMKLFGGEKLSTEEFNAAIEGEIGRLGGLEGKIVYSEYSGYNYLSNEFDEYDPEKDMIPESEFVPESVMSRLYGELDGLLNRTGSATVSIETVERSIADTVYVAPNEKIYADINGGGTVATLGAGQYSLWFDFEGLNNDTIDFGQPYEVLCTVDGVEKTVYRSDGDEIDLPTSHILTLNLSRTAEYSFAIRNLGDEALPFNRCTVYPQEGYNPSSGIEVE